MGKPKTLSFNEAARVLGFNDDGTAMLHAQVLFALAGSLAAEGKTLAIMNGARPEAIVQAQPNGGVYLKPLKK